MSSTLTPNMSLIIPGVGTQGGPQYAQDVNDSLTILDQHDHTPGSGVQITPEAINITSALSFNSNPATTLSYVGLTPQVSAPPVGSLYEKGVDLYYRDGNGNEVQITIGGGVAGTPGSISNLLPPASVTYVGASQTFVFQSNTNIAANLDVGSILLRNLAPNSTYSLTLSPPSALSTDYTVTLPSLPLAASFLTMSTAGAITGSIATSKGITAANIADGTITGALIASATIPASKLSFSAAAPGTVSTFTSSGTFTVPAGVTTIFVQAVGGGGGGGGGRDGGGGGGVAGGPGGAGGAGGYINQSYMTVTPGEAVTVTVGAGGTAGGAGAATPGGNGGTTTVAATTSGWAMYAVGGLGGGVNSTLGSLTASTGGAQQLIRTIYNAGGGNGSGCVGAFNNTAGMDSLFAPGGAFGARGAANSEDGGGGGGGAGSFGAGGNGGIAGSIAGASQGGAGTQGFFGGGGGGGGGGRSTGSSPGGVGGVGGGGLVNIFYIPVAT